jgi:hypothetical protein
VKIMTTIRRSPRLTLLLLAPFIAEVLFGSVPLTHLPAFVLIVGLYGGGALLIREMVRRRNLPSYWLLILGLAFAIFAEGLVQQSFFNPHYPGISFLGWYSRAWGVNWIWAIFLTGYHAVISITVPIILTELTFPDQRLKPWLNKRWLKIAGGLLALSSAAIALIIGDALGRKHSLPGPQLLASAGIVAAIIGAALAVRPKATTPHTERRLPKAGWLRLLGFLAAFGWIFARGLASDEKNLPPVVVPLVAFGIIAAAINFFVWLWSRPGYKWTPERRFAIAAGPLPVTWLLGFAIAGVVGFLPPLDLLGQAGFGVLMFVGLHRLHRAVRGTS